MQFKIINRSQNPLPDYATIGSAGMDLRANLSEPITIHPTEIVLIPTGIYLELPAGFEAQIRPRSGLALKHGITVLNSPGTIDSDYRNEIKVVLINHSQQSFEIANGERIAQMVIASYEKVEWTLVEALSETERGQGGFGSTGKQ